MKNYYIIYKYINIQFILMILKNIVIMFILFMFYLFCIKKQHNGIHESIFMLVHSYMQALNSLQS